MAHNLALGAHGEELAAHFLHGAGLQIVERNWRCRYGELDIIATEGETTAFVEVKTRSGVGFGIPAESVTFTKRQRIRRLALLWLAEQSGPWHHVRFDVVSILLPPGGQAQIDHVRAAF